MVLANSFPKPKCWVYTSQACDNTPKSGEGMAEFHGVPFYKGRIAGKGGYTVGQY